MAHRFAVTLFVVALAGCMSGTRTVEEQLNFEIVQDVFVALGEDDLAILEKYFDPDGEVVIGLNTRKRGGPYTRFRDVAGYPGSLDDVTVEVENMIADGDSVAVRSLICGNHAEPIYGFKPTGKRVCARYLNLYVLKDGIIVSNSVGLYRDQLRKQLEANKTAD